jgi:adenylate kinase family enzyme
MKNYLLGNRIAVIGPTGGGKTTFAEKLSGLINIRHVEMDSIFWKPGWEEPSKEEFRKKIKEVTAETEWIIDGNYAGIQDLTLSRAETIIWLDTGKFLSVYRVFMRSLKRIINKKKLWNINNESIKRLFTPKDSIVLFAYRSHKRKKSRYTKLFVNSKNNNFKVIRIKNKTEEKDFWNSIIKNPA